ncbi:MAG: ComF family protein [Acutalibacteraceae bacterium]
MNIRKIKDFLISLVFPKRCVICGDVISFNEHLCDSCGEDVNSETIIRFIQYAKSGETIVCVSPFKYEGKIRKAILKFKFQGHTEYAQPFAKIISEKICKNFKINNIDINDIDYVCAVPLSEKRIFERGYNQSELLAKEISKNLSIPMNNVLKKIRETSLQHSLDAKEREQNLFNAFSVVKGVNIRDKNFILCDDIITTGNTLKECVKALKKCGAGKIVCCTIASMQMQDI